MNSIFYLILLILLVAAVCTDLRTRTIPNWIPAAAIMLFVPAAWVGAVSHWQIHLIVFAVVFAACLGLFAINILGGGDAKLIPAVALWAGTEHLVSFLVVMTLAGGAVALFQLLHPSRWRRREPETPSGPERGASIPYAVAIAAGGLVVVSEPILNAFPASWLEILKSGA